MLRMVTTASLALLLACSASHEMTEGSGSGDKAESAAGGPVVVFETNMGTIKVVLYPEKCQVTVDNFLKYVDEGFYQGTVFHRVVPGFVIQGGGITADMVEKPTHEPIRNEARTGLSNKRGTIAMARTGERDSATSQFFFNLVNNTRLDYTGENERGWGYTAFGKVIQGMDVIDLIAASPTGARGEFPSDVPLRDVVITKAYRE